MAETLARAIDPGCQAWDQSAEGCSCSLKSFVVPADHPDLWKAAAADSPIGASSVVPSSPYLGVTVASGGRPGDARGWSAPGMRKVAAGTW